MSYATTTIEAESFSQTCSKYYLTKNMYGCAGNMYGRAGNMYGRAGNMHMDMLVSAVHMDIGEKYFYITLSR